MLSCTQIFIFHQNLTFPTTMELELLKGDITKIKVDAIVNAANTSLLGGGGVDGAIHRAGGPRILAECRQIRNRQGGCPVGKAVMTTAGQLPAQKVIHTVGPVWNGGQSQEIDKLRNCYINSLKLAEQHQLQTIAFPNISTGIYGFPKAPAADIAIQAVTHYPFVYLQKVIFVCFDEENFQLYQKKLA